MGIESEGDVRGVNYLKKSRGDNFFNSRCRGADTGDGQPHVAVDVGAVGEFFSCKLEAILEDMAGTNANI